MKLKGNLAEDSIVLITPLIDIMFLILIFFILNTSFTENKVVEVDVPQTISGSESGEIEVLILLTKDHKIYINENETALATFSMSLLDATTNLSNPVIIIEGDKNISYDFLMGIMDRVKVLGFNNISLIVRKL